MSFLGSYFSVPLNPLPRSQWRGIERFWFIEDTLIARHPAPENTWFHTQLHTGDHVAYVCTECGRVWARSVLAWPHARWSTMCKPCPACGPSLLLNACDYMHTWALARFFPPELLKREFLILMETYDAKHQSNI